jgi:hypothetical protein
LPSGAESEGANQDRLDPLQDVEYRKLRDAANQLVET